MKTKLLIVVSLLLFSCSKTSPSKLIGTWELERVNGKSIMSGVYLKWTFTETTITVTSDMNCVEVYEYEANNGMLSLMAVLSQEGAQCGDGEDDLGELGAYEISGSTLTVTITDPKIDPPKSTFIFVKVE